MSSCRRLVLGEGNAWMCVCVCVASPDTRWGCVVPFVLRGVSSSSSSYFLFGRADLGH